LQENVTEESLYRHGFSSNAIAAVSVLEIISFAVFRISLL
jgi:hypothetical protein